MRKYKAGDSVLIKDNFLTSLQINPVEISGFVEEESQKKYGDYYVSTVGTRLEMLHENSLMTINELGKIEVNLTGGEYSYLQFFFQDLVDSEYAVKVSHNHYHYCECDIVLKSNGESNVLLIKLISGGIKNMVYLSIEVGRFFELKKIEIEENNDNNRELRRRQDNENFDSNRRWNERQQGI